MRMSKQKDNHVRIGKKPKTKYVTACLFSLDKYDETVIEGLGRWSDKVLEIAEKLEEISNIETGSPAVIDVDGVSGLRIKIKNKGEGDTVVT